MARIQLFLGKDLVYDLYTVYETGKFNIYETVLFFETPAIFEVVTVFEFIHYINSGDSLGRQNSIQ
jgi:hypothetical protein